MSVNDSRYVVSWRPMDLDAKNQKIAEGYRRYQEQRGISSIDPSEVHPMTDTLEIRSVGQSPATYGPAKPAADKETNNAAATRSVAPSVTGESVDASMEIKVDLENKTVQMGEVTFPSIQGVGYRINDDWSLTPFIDCLPADNPNSALAFFEKRFLGVNTGDPFSSIMKYLTDNLPSIRERIFPGNTAAG